LNFLDRFSKNTQNFKYTENSFSVGAELFHADGQTDMTELIVAFHRFASAPKIRIVITDDALSAAAYRSSLVVLVVKTSDGLCGI